MKKRPKKLEPIKVPDPKLDAFRRANVALLFLTPQERECVIKAAAIIFGVSW